MQNDDVLILSAILSSLLTGIRLKERLPIYGYPEFSSSEERQVQCLIHPVSYQDQNSECLLASTNMTKDLRFLQYFDLMNLNILDVFWATADTLGSTQALFLTSQGFGFLRPSPVFISTCPRSLRLSSRFSPGSSCARFVMDLFACVGNGFIETYFLCRAAHPLQMCRVMIQNARRCAAVPTFRHLGK